MTRDSRINLDARVGRQLNALITTGSRRGVVLVTISVFTAEGSSRYHETFAIRKWKGGDGDECLSVSIHKSGDWRREIAPITCLHMNLTTGRLFEARDERGRAELIRYAAEQALRYAWTGSTAQPANGRVEAEEAAKCGACGRTLTDPYYIELGIGPECSGDRGRGSRTMRSYVRGQMALEVEAEPELATAG